MAKIHIRCPHCDGYVNLEIHTEAADPHKKKGPPKFNPGPEIDKFVITAIDEFKLSYHNVAGLLEEKNVPSAQGGTRWYATSVKRLYEYALDRRNETPSVN